MSPYPSTRRALVSFSNDSCTSTGSGAEPLMQALIDLMLYLRTPRKLLIATYMLGEPGKMVGLYFLMVFSTSKIWNCGFKIKAAPKETGTFKAAVIP